MRTELRRLVWERDGGICGFCKMPVAWELMHVDHIDPRCHGGTDALENLQTAHATCNVRASSKGWARRPPQPSADGSKLFGLRMTVADHAHAKRLAEQYGKSLHWVILRAIDVSLPMLEEEAKRVSAAFGR